MEPNLETPTWLEYNWINLSEICFLLYGKKDTSTTGQFSMKRKGLRPWKKDELNKLEEIRKELMATLAGKA